MENNDERFQEKLNPFENGQPVEDCMEGLEVEDAELLRLASSLRTFQPPARKQEAVMAQLAAITQIASTAQTVATAQAVATAQTAAPSVKAPRPTNSVLRKASQALSQIAPKPWFLPVVATSSAFVLLFFWLLIALVGFGTNRMIAGMNSEKASVQEVRGLVETQANNGEWTVVNTKTRLVTGARIRTGQLSGAQLKLADGSQVRVGPQTEIVLDQMDRSFFGSRVIRITQWRGETHHDVQSSKSSSSLYEVRTPSSTSTARGTAFTVSMDEEQGTRVNVTEGTVFVTGDEATVSVPAGQTTSVALAQDPAAPALLIQGEGILEAQTEPWKIAGQPIALSPSTQMVVAPKHGDLVAFEGQQLPDGTLQIDRMEPLVNTAAVPFRLTGTLEETADTALVAANAAIQTDAQTRITGVINTGDEVTVEGVILPDQTWLATSVNGGAGSQPFEFSGVVDSIEEDNCTISGITVLIDENTQIETASTVGEVVSVQGWIQDNGDRLAASIRPAVESEPTFDYTGIVKDTDPWMVDDVSFETRSWTAISLEIETGDRVRVRGPILTDGTWVAASIVKIEETPEDVALVFVGTLNSFDPWVVSGIPLAVDDNTWIGKNVMVGSTVEVQAVRLDDGSWYAKSILAIIPGNQGCVTYASVVTEINDNLLTLQDGSIIDLDVVEQVEGDIQVESVILVVKCMGADGTITYPFVRVVENPSEEPTATPTLTRTATPTITPTMLPQSIILPNCYKVTFLGMVDNGNGTTTWRYFVEELSCAQDLSNWVLELPACSQIVDASPSPWEAVNPDPNHHLNGIKWQTGAGFDRGEFTVTLAGDLITGVTQVGAKGPDVAIGSLAGPICNPGTPTPSPTPGPSETPTQPVTPSATIEVPPTQPPAPTAAPTMPPPPPPPASSGPIDISNNDQALTLNCNGAAVTVRGNNNTVTLLGQCSSLTVRGNSNTITLQAPTVITNTGNNNIIR